MIVLSILLMPFAIIDESIKDSEIAGQLVMFGATILACFIWSRYVYREKFKSIGSTPFGENGWKELLWGVF